MAQQTTAAECERLRTGIWHLICSHDWDHDTIEAQRIASNHAVAEAMTAEKRLAQRLRDLYEATS